MNFRKTILAVSVVVFSLNALAGTVIAPANRIRIWEGSAVSFPDSQYSIGTTTAMGAIKTLKSNSTVLNLLQNFNIAANAGGLDMSSKYFSAITFNGSSHQRITESGGAPGQCVAFAKAMTGATASTTWYPGKKLTDYVYWNGAGYVLNTSVLPVIQPGTMIAHFGGKTRYDYNSATPHVAIFLSWSKNAQGFVDGVNVVDENIAWTIAGNTGSAAGLIQKHKLAWVCNAGTSCGTATSTVGSTYHITFFGSNYHVVDVR